MTDTTGTETGTEGNPDAAAAAAAAAAEAAKGAAPKTDDGEPDPNAKPVETGGADPFAELDQDSREWATKNGIKDLKGLAKQAHEQSKLLGNAIRIPGKDAKPEEVAAYHEKLGVPKTADEYGFKVPETLPKDLPYDGERAKRFAEKAKELNIPKGAANALHDWFTGEVVGDFNTSQEADSTRKVETAKAETEKLIKQWGPITGETFRAEARFADKALMEFGGQEVVDAFKQAGLIGEGGEDGGIKIVQSAPVMNMFAKLGKAFFKEADVLRGDASRMNNPFAEGAEFNVTSQMKLYKEDPDMALQFIAAAGKKPEDFGLKSK